jgi:23S rRNA (cytosine1962-C5)-methyltransferase
VWKAVGVVVIKPGHVQPVWAGHPWVFAQAVERVEGGAAAGDEVLVKDSRGHTLGRGLYSPGSAIVVRLYTRDSESRIDAALIERRLVAALERRRAIGLPSETTNAYRLVHGEGDGLPALIVDRLGDALAVQIGTIGLKLRQDIILDALTRLCSPRAIVDRTTERAAQTEGFRAERGVVRGDPELSSFQFLERGLAYGIPLELAQKTGFYLDQRDLRARVEQLSRGRRVLDTYCYVGAMALAAARGGASSVDAVDSSALALEVAAECAAKNQLGELIHFECGDASEALRHAGRKGGYDLVVCDPPKLAPTRAVKNRALETMRRLAAAACGATRPGGLLVMCSCSAAIGQPELTRALALGARDVGLQTVVLERHFQGPDHPVPAAFPEGLYLSSLIVEVTTL